MTVACHESGVRHNQVGCPSGQREQAVNLPALAYVGSNPTPTTNITVIGSDFAGVAQLVERQPSKLNVAGSTPVSRSAGSLKEVCDSAVSVRDCDSTR